MDYNRSLNSEIAIMDCEIREMEKFLHKLVIANSWLMQNIQETQNIFELKNEEIEYNKKTLLWLSDTEAKVFLIQNKPKKTKTKF
jgi:hypothetical protein